MTEQSEIARIVADQADELKFCKSCAGEVPATCFGIVTLKDGRALKWPLCDYREPFAMVAGWFPVTRLDALLEQEQS